MLFNFTSFLYTSSTILNNSVALYFLIFFKGTNDDKNIIAGSYAQILKNEVNKITQKHQQNVLWIRKRNSLQNGGKPHGFKE